MPEPLASPGPGSYSWGIRIHTLDLRFRDIPEVIASYLIEGPERCFLIETGPESCREALLEAIRDAGATPGDVEAVFVTHIHLDHSGGAGWWAQQGVPVHVHPKGARHLVDPSRLVESARMVYGDAFDDLWGEPLPAPEEKVTVLEDGERKTVAGIEVRALDTPGHAFHHHAFVIGEWCFCGDAAGVRLPGHDFLSLTSAPPQFHLEHTLASLEKMTSENFEALYLTHFGRVESPGEHLAGYRETVEGQAAFIRERMAEGMDGESLQVAYEAFNLERAFRQGLPSPDWSRYQAINPTGMCADGIRLFWEKQ